MRANRGPRRHRHLALIPSNALPNSRASVKHLANTINFASAIKRPSATDAAISRRRRSRQRPSAAPTPPRRGMKKARAAATTMEAKRGAKRSGSMNRRARRLPFWRTILELMGERGEITVTEEDSEGIELAIKGDGSGLLIGRHGQTLDSLEYLVNRILARRIKDAVPITIDTESYRERRRRQLHRMALSMAEQTKREHASVTLDPMPPRDRRIVHLALKDDPLITTRSTGDGFLRVVEIIPVGERRESGGARGADGRVAAGVVAAVIASANASPIPSASAISRSASRAASSTGRNGCSSLNKSLPTGLAGGVSIQSAAGNARIPSETSVQGLRIVRLEAHALVDGLSSAELTMKALKSFLAAAVVMLMLAAPALAQYAPWPAQIPPPPAWGEYDQSHTWHDASWWWENQPEWVQANHPDWWGDFDEDHMWHPAGWWWQNEPAWTQLHHPEWWGDFYQGVWYPASWWWQYQPAWTRANHPEWWGYRDNGVWYPASWWWQHKRAWMLEHHPDWWGNYDQDRWYPADWWWAHRPDYAHQNHPDWWGDFDDHHVWHNDSWWHQNNPPGFPSIIPNGRATTTPSTNGMT